MAHGQDFRNKKSAEGKIFLWKDCVAASQAELNKENAPQARSF